MFTGTIDTRSIESVSEEHKFHKWYMTSAKDGTGVDEMFEDLSRLMVEHQKQKLEKIRNRKKLVMNLNDQGNKTKRFCQC